MKVKLLRSSTLAKQPGVYFPRIGVIKYGNGLGLFAGNWLLQISR